MPLPPADPSETAATASYYLRWRGQTLGPFAWPEIQRQLARREIGLLHEVYCGGKWIRLRDFRPDADYARASAPFPAAPPRGNEPNPPTAVAAASGGEQFFLRWRGQNEGPFSFEEIENKLDRQDIGMLHEVSLGGEWVKLNDFFVRRNAVLAQTRGGQPATRAAGGLRSGRAGARIVLQQVCQQVPNGARILDDINLVIEPNEFVALLGPSGSGKSTLMNAMTGRRRASHGQISLNGDDFYANADRYSRKIGHVPQKDIVHYALSVFQELNFSARLRLPAGAPRDTINQRVADVVCQTGLQERVNTRISDLSGGQLKRVSLGIEILSNPELLFLDEATSGLDAGTEARMMALFRKLADSGRTVVCITHNLENVCLCDLVILLTAGRLVYYGPPSDLLTHFKLEKLSEVYDCLETRTPDEWTQLYRESESYQQYVVQRQQVTPAELAAQRSFSFEPSLTGIPKPSSPWHQLWVLTQRYLTVTVQDRKNVILLLAQAPIIALLLGLVFRNENFQDAVKGAQSQRTLSFLLVVSAIWFGCINAAREIVKELPIYLRERAVHLNLGSYLASKIAILSMLCALQCSALLVITRSMTSLKPDLATQAGCLLMTSLSGMLLGLLVSALVKNEDKAMAVVPILLIPQVIFSGAILDLSGLAAAIAKWVVVAYWAFDAMLHSLPASQHPLLKPNCKLAEDLVTIGAFQLALTALTALALKHKDPLK